METKKFVTRGIIVFAAAVLAASSLAGCQKSSTEEERVGETTSDPNLEGNVYKTGMPIVKDKMTYKVVVKANGLLKRPAKEIEGWRVLENDTNIALDIEEIPDSAWGEKVNLMIASGSLPDFFTESIPDITNKYYNTGLFLPLDDLIDKYAPNLKKIISDKQVKTALSAPDGKIYATPRGEMSPWLYVGEQLFINRKWLDKLGLKSPETTEELFEVLKAFKEKDPNGNGLSDEIPLSLSYKSGNQIIKLSGAFGLAFNGNYEAIVDGKYVFAPVRQEFRAWLEFLNRLYTAGLLDKDLFTQQTAQIKAKASAADQVLGSFMSFWPDNVVNPADITTYETVKPLKGPGGHQEWTFDKTKLLPTSTGLSISKNAKNPEAIIRWVDYIVSNPLKTVELEWGPTTLGALEIKDGKYKVDANAVSQAANMTVEQWKRNFTLQAMLPTYYSEDIKNYRILDPEASRKLAYQEVYKPYQQKEGVTSVHFSIADENDKSQMNTISVEMKALIENFIAKAVLKGFNDSEWNKFQDDLKKAKADKLIELKQKALDTYYKQL